jgi:hypothetical protein
MTDIGLIREIAGRDALVVEPTDAHSPEDLAVLANASHHVARQHVRAGVEHALRAGRALTLAKQQIAHGEWTDWLTANFEGTPRTARRWMQAASAVETGRATDLEPASVRALLVDATENSDDAQRRGGSHQAVRDPVERLLAAVHDAAVHFCYDRGAGAEFAVRLGEAVVSQARTDWVEEWPSIRAVLARILEVEQREGGGP